MREREKKKKRTNYTSTTTKTNNNCQFAIKYRREKMGFPRINRKTKKRKFSKSRQCVRLGTHFPSVRQQISFRYGLIRQIQQQSLRLLISVWNTEISAPYILYIYTVCAKKNMESTASSAQAHRKQNTARRTKHEHTSKCL